MSGERAAHRYAKAALSIAMEENATAEVNDDMVVIAKTIEEHKDLKDVLHSPVVRSYDKKTVLFNIFKGLHKITVNTIDVLLINKRINLLETVAKSYTGLLDQHNGTQIAKVTTAVPLTDKLKAQVLVKVKELTGKEVEVINIIDESIVGGFILRVGDIQYDSSIANKLEKLKREFTLN